MFGYVIDEIEEFMFFIVVLVYNFNRVFVEKRRNGIMKWVRLDFKI